MIQLGENSNSQSRASIIVSLIVRTALAAVIIIGSWCEHSGRLPGWFLWTMRLGLPWALASAWYRSLQDLRALRRTASPKTAREPSAEPDAAPNDGPAEPPSSSGVSGGPPPVS